MTAVSRIADLRDTVVAYLNDCARSYSVQFTAVGSYIPLLNLAKGDLNNLQVVVFVDPEFKIENMSRELKNETWLVHIGILKKVTDKFSLSEVDALSLLYQEISDSLVWKDFDILVDNCQENWNWHEQQPTPVYDVEELNERGVFAAAIKINYETHHQ